MLSDSVIYEERPTMGGDPNTGTWGGGPAEGGNMQYGYTWSTRTPVWKRVLRGLYWVVMVTLIIAAFLAICLGGVYLAGRAILDATR